MISAKLTEEEASMVRTAQMGGTMAKGTIASFNEDVDKQCNYCKEDVSTAEHIRWRCKFFQGIREATDEQLAKVPVNCLTACIKCGIAPEMKGEPR